MSDAEKQGEEQTENKKGSPVGIIFIVLVLLAVILGLGAYKNAQKKEGMESNVAQESVTAEEYIKSVASEDSSAEPIDAQQSEEQNAEGEQASTEVQDTIESAFDFEAAATPRILGNPDAPVRISEHSSFTCPGCAGFHEENFKKIKEDYVDTGKAYIVFDDYPRNRYDITVGAIARCVPEESYFNFVQLLFETQDSWLNTDYIKHVKQNAMLSGASESDIAQCLGNTKLYEVLAKRQAKAADSYPIEGTPSLIINETVTISGLAPYARIQSALDTALAESQKETVAPTE
ncbi:MAG: thioredoxin domain-containing protein [Alphaproteobacteria bacterium]